MLPEGLKLLTEPVLTKYQQGLIHRRAIQQGMLKLSILHIVLKMSDPKVVAASPRGQ